jgi:hypothetical protein
MGADRPEQVSQSAGRRADQLIQPFTTDKQRVSALGPRAAAYGCPVMRSPIIIDRARSAFCASLVAIGVAAPTGQDNEP